MQVSSEKSFEVANKPEVVWGILKDIDKIVPCVPGAKITEIVSDNDYRGAVSVKVGPVTQKYKGEFSLQNVNDDDMTLSIDGKGKDLKGKGSASMVMNARVEAAGSGAKVTTVMDATVTGKMAQLGSRMFEEVNNQIFEKFVNNFKALIPAEEAPAPAATADDAGEAATTPVAETAATPEPTPQSEPEAVNGLSLVFKAIWNIIKGWFSKKKPAEG